MAPKLHKDKLTGILLARNVERSVINAGPDQHREDKLTASGWVYAKATDTKRVGIFDLTALTASADGDQERQQVDIDLSLNDSYVRRSRRSKKKGHSDIKLMGDERYPLGGNPSNPIQLSISDGTGVFTGKTGIAEMSYSSDSLFSYKFSLYFVS